MNINKLKERTGHLNLQIQFADKLINYDEFMHDLSARVTRMMKSDLQDPEYISQRQAYKIFGRRNIDRWKRVGLITPSKHVGKFEYRMADLRLLQRTEQDYLYK